jgi:hypothetical protein
MRIAEDSLKFRSRLWTMVRREDDFTQPENHGAVVCRALTNRKETPFLAQLLSPKNSGPLETPFQAFLIVGWRQGYLEVATRVLYNSCVWVQGRD